MRDYILIRSYSAPCGELLLGAVGDRLCLCDWVEGRRHEGAVRRTERMLSAVRRNGYSEVTERAARQLDEYFMGMRQTFDIPLLLGGTDFQRQVWERLTQIPYGTTISYSDEARLMGCPEAVRAVAGANGANPVALFVPCHRVTGSDGSLNGYRGGREMKRFLIDHERKTLARLTGVPLKRRGR